VSPPLVYFICSEAPHHHHTPRFFMYATQPTHPRPVTDTALVAAVVETERISHSHSTASPSSKAMLIIPTPAMAISLALLLHTPLQRRNSASSLQQHVLALAHTAVVDKLGAQIKQRLIDLMSNELSIVKSKHDQNPTTHAPPEPSCQGLSSLRWESCSEPYERHDA